ncbi:hypothetical protein [Candidatus Methanodesulfokora washburnensis]|uniref:Uncharacterized protein n=1 Tax=Candidatus Methanodesulfokora washburnensis TaxID=2478471 RepID=A0A429GFN4_9CREN|nr:hypothetical protein [Candidatus Methanodesulfokores washburnensis]RSN72453.1 hypothetical protein D6D85_13665 [Candidatus Methanodesulfokores washburnensis]
MSYHRDEFILKCMTLGGKPKEEKGGGADFFYSELKCTLPDFSLGKMKEFITFLKSLGRPDIDAKRGNVNFVIETPDDKNITGFYKQSYYIDRELGLDDTIEEELIVHVFPDNRLALDRIESLGSEYEKRMKKKLGRQGARSSLVLDSNHGAGVALIAHTYGASSSDISYIIEEMRSFVREGQKIMSNISAERVSKKSVVIL